MYVLQMSGFIACFTCGPMMEPEGLRNNSLYFEQLNLKMTASRSGLLRIGVLETSRREEDPDITENELLQPRMTSALHYIRLSALFGFNITHLSKPSARSPRKLRCLLGLTTILKPSLVLGSTDKTNDKT